MRPRIGLLVLFLSASPLWAKPKVEVRVKASDGVGIDRPQDALSKGGGASLNTILYGTVYYWNVTVRSDNAEAVARNNGQWCISSDIDLDASAEYRGILDGNRLELEIPQKNGKIKKTKFEIFDRKWKKLSDLVR